MLRLMAYDRRRYWLENGWSVQFRVRQVTVSEGRPDGLKYAFTLHDETGERLLGFDNAHGVGREQRFDHRHRFRRTAELVAYTFTGADALIGDFFDAVEAACRTEGVAFACVDEDELEWDDDDATDQPE